MIITTERLVLMPYHAGMVTPKHIFWLNDPDVVRYSEQRHQKHTQESQHRYLNAFDRTIDHIWLIRVRVSGIKASVTFDIGTITAYENRPNLRADMGILIGEKEHWGKGYGTEAWKAVMEWLWKKGTIKIEGGCMENNISMRKLFKKAGMEVEGVKSYHFILDKKPVALVHYGASHPYAGAA